MSRIDEIEGLSQRPGETVDFAEGGISPAGGRGISPAGGGDFVLTDGGCSCAEGGGFCPDGREYVRHRTGDAPARRAHKRSPLPTSCESPQLEGVPPQDFSACGAKTK